jgi:hypothetical protein
MSHIRKDPWVEKLTDSNVEGRGFMYEHWGPALCLGLGLSLASADANAAINDSPRMEAYGDVLPPGSLARFGSTRLRHIGPFPVLAFSPDGRKLLSVSDAKLCLWEAASGKLLRKAILQTVEGSGLSHRASQGWTLSMARREFGACA